MLFFCTSKATGVRSSFISGAYKENGIIIIWSTNPTGHKFIHLKQTYIKVGHASATLFSR